MLTVQLALASEKYAEALGHALAADRLFHDWQVERVQIPDPSRKGLIVLDGQALDHLPDGLPHPERVVLIVAHDPEQLHRAWNAGIVSVIYLDDPLSTAMLAIMAARVRTLKSSQ